MYGSIEGLWDAEQVARFFCVSTKTVYRLAKLGLGPPFVRYGRTLRWAPHVVEEWAKRSGFVR